MAALSCGLAAPLARAGGVQITMMMDDDNLIYRGDKVRDKTLAKMKSLGVDYVRVTLLWSVVAEHARDTKRAAALFKRRGADDPRAYPKGNWDRYDNLVRSAQGMGLGVYFNVTGPGPAWGHEKAPASEQRSQASWKPIPRQFKLFVRAVGRRYSGTYKDENFQHKKIPRVAFWSLWNEPNQGGWLTPQWWHGKAYSPYLFRNLYIAGHEGLVGTGHGKDVILMGETAPNGKSSRSRSRNPMYPVTFIRSLFCVDGAGHKINGKGCSVFANGPLQATAYAHHPYTKDRSPLEKDPSPLAITMANVDTLTKLLDQIAANTGRFQANALVALTEFGYETKPPDPYHGVSLAKQADYSNIADFLSWLNPRVISQTQFLLRDVAPDKSYPKTSKRYWFSYQSGLFFHNGKAKPAAAAYQFPFLAFPYATDAQGRKSFFVWGQTRFRPNTVKDLVYLQFKPDDKSTGWVSIGQPIVTQARNYFSTAVTVPSPGKLRAVWGGKDPPYLLTSRPVDAK
ncbi:MAG: hypothetical protein QOG68_1361 [Solirubrobacteraceae bacterium]|nr:hypothetical protein [Solirubrobacteraceae bacterium]